MLEHRVKHDCNADEVNGVGTALVAACGYMGRLLACNCSCDGFVVVVIAVGYITKVVETSRLETRATEFVLFASVLHCSEERAAKAFSHKIPFLILREGRA